MRQLLFLLPITAFAAGPSGNWQCQSAEGPATLAFINASQLSYNGETMRYQERDHILWVEENGLQRPYPYQLKGKQLTIHTPDGGQIACQRGSAAPQQATPSGGGANGMLRGRMCSWSGSRSGSNSYSSSHRVNFDGQGRFSYGSEASYSGTPGQYGSQGGGQQGRYQVTAARVGAPVHLQWDSGRRETLYVHFISGGRITELKAGNLLFAAQLCE